MPTTWIPDPQEDQRMWVLDNRKLVEAPKTELTSAGRRVRLAGQPETSVYTKDRRKVIEEAVERVAKREKTSILACTNTKRAHRAEEAQLPVPRIATDKLNFNLVWIYRHPDAPLYAQLIVKVHKGYYRNGEYEVEAKLTFDEISVRARHEPFTGEASELAWDVGGRDNYWSNVEEQKRTIMQQAAITPHLQRRQYRSERAALKAVREIMEVFDRQLSVEVPDARSDSITWIAYSFLRTNVDGEFTADINAYLDSEASILQATEAYESLREAMRRLGIKLPDRGEDDFARALTTSYQDALSIEVPTQRQNGEQDRDHELFLHLASGTITILCDHDINHENIANEWTLARFEAEMRGELQAFIDFHKATRERRRQQLVHVIQANHAGRSQL